MNAYLLIVILNFSIAIPAGVAIVRFRLINNSFYPFIALIGLGLLNESLSLAMIYHKGSNLVNSNIYVLLEFGVILFQFYKWNERSPRKFLYIAAIGVVVWILDNVFINSLTSNNSIYRIIYSFTVVIFSIDQINKIVIFEKGRILTNPTFLVCIGFFLTYTTKTFVETFNLATGDFSNGFLGQLWFILCVINCISNLIYAIAILCIPTRQEFTLPF